MKQEEMEGMRPAVVTSDAGVVEGIFTSYESALGWVKQHQMDERNVRGGVPFHDVQFTAPEAQPAGACDHCDCPDSVLCHKCGKFKEKPAAKDEVELPKIPTDELSEVARLNKKGLYLAAHQRIIEIRERQLKAALAERDAALLRVKELEREMKLAREVENHRKELILTESQPCRSPSDGRQTQLQD